MRCSRWNPHGDGAEIWQRFAADGSVPESNNDRRSGKDDPLSAAMALRFELAPGAELELPVVISRDLPVTAFATAANAQALHRFLWPSGVKPPPSPLRPCSAGPAGASRSRSGKRPCCCATTCPRSCAWRCSMSCMTCQWWQPLDGLPAR